MLERWGVFCGFALLLVLIFVDNAALFWYRDGSTRVIVWLITVGLLVLVLAVVGIGVNDRPAGIIIDNRNVVSFSKLQMVAWTVLVISALITAAAANLFDLFGSLTLRELDIDIPPEILAAMGMAALSMTATPALLGIKAREPTDQASLARTSTMLGLAPDEVRPQGKVFGRAFPGDASWADIFRGDEVGNAAAPDLSKVQQFLVTVLLLAIYAGGIWSMFLSEASFHALPQLDEKFIWLMAISHGSYLTYKAAPH